MIQSIHDLKTIEYFRIISEKITVKVGGVKVKVHNINHLGFGFYPMKLRAWKKICVECSEFIGITDDITEKVNRRNRLYMRAFDLEKALKVLAYFPAENAPNTVKFMESLGIVGDREYMINHGRNMQAGTLANMQEIDRTLEKQKEIEVTMADCLKEFRYINSALIANGGQPVSLEDRFSLYLTAKQEIQQRNGKNSDN